MDAFYGGITGGFLAIFTIEGVKVAARLASAIGRAIVSRRRKRTVAEAVASVPAGTVSALATVRQVRYLIELGVNPRDAARLDRRRAAKLIELLAKKR